MSVTDSDLQTAIVQGVGDADDGILATNITAIWALYADKAQIAPRLQFLYAKREACDWVLGDIRKNVDFTTPTLSVQLSQETDRLQSLREETQTEIERIETRARANRAAQGAVLVAVAPESPPSWWQGPNANNPRYRGDPYRPGFNQRIIR